MLYIYIFLLFLLFVKLNCNLLIVWDRNNRRLRGYEFKYSYGVNSRVELEVDLRSQERKKRCLYFFISHRWDETFFSGLPKNVKFAVYELIEMYIFNINMFVYFLFSFVALFI